MARYQVVDMVKEVHLIYNRNMASSHQKKGLVHNYVRSLRSWFYPSKLLSCVHFLKCYLSFLLG